jgi:hypothetical protein
LTLVRDRNAFLSSDLCPTLHIHQPHWRHKKTGKHCDSGLYQVSADYFN